MTDLEKELVEKLAVEVAAAYAACAEYCNMLADKESVKETEADAMGFTSTYHQDRRMLLRSIADKFHSFITPADAAWELERREDVLIREAYRMGAEDEHYGTKKEFTLDAVRERLASLSKPAPMSDEQIKYMVDRFLGWRLPENFNPDGGISFKPTFNEGFSFGPMKNEPTGTNLFDVTQAEAMIRYLVDGLPR